MPKRGRRVKPRASHPPPAVDTNCEAQIGDRRKPCLENVQFEAYYQRQGICLEGEWEEFIAALRTGLPAAARVNLGAHTASELLTQLQRLSQETADLAPRRLDWFPKGLAWQWDRLSTLTIRTRSENKRLKAYLCWLSGHGSLTRQEAVSMVPPLCLDLKPEHVVLDMCAAPGSKASQVVEMLHWDHSDASSTAISGETPKGVLIANELVPKRADLLTHTVLRLGSPCFAVTQLDATFFPNIIDARGSPLLFDRIIADVPCSGDGTLRKSQDLWQKWTPKDAIGLHHRQFTILSRGLDVLKPGGRLVYSTCSFNPLEDEAVVLAALLKTYGGHGVRLEPLPTSVQDGLQGCPGLATWVVSHPDDGQVCWTSLQEVPDEVRAKLRPSLFAPKPGSDEAATWELQRCRCRRFLPHRSDGGGFFVAVFVKEEVPAVRKQQQSEGHCCALGIKNLAASYWSQISQIFKPVGDKEAAAKRQDSESHTDSTTQVEEKKRHKKLRVQKPIGDFQPVMSDDPAWLQAATFFGLDPALACHLRRRSANEKRLYWVSDEASRFLDGTAPFKLHVCYAGVRILEQLGASRLNDQPMWRLAQEGLPLLLRHGLQRHISVSVRFMRQWLTSKELDVNELHKAAEAGEIEGFERLKPTPEQLLAGHPPGLVSGGLAVTLLGSHEPCGKHPGLAVCALLSQKSITSYVSQVEATALCESLELEARTTAMLSGSLKMQIETDQNEGEYDEQEEM